MSEKEKMTRRTRFWIYRFLCQRDGEKCSKKDETCKGPLVIHHINGNEGDERPENMCLLCKSHNAKETPLDTREREKKYEEGSAEMWVNVNSEPPFRRWVMDTIVDRDEGYMTKADAINGGAERFEVSPTTTRKHLSKLTSSEGPLKEVKDKQRGRIIRFRNVDELGARE